MYLTCVSLCLFFGNPFELCKLFCIFFAGAIAATGAATLTVAAATAIAANAAMLVRVPHNQARAPKHNNRTNNGRQIKVRGQEFHHTEHTLSNWTDDFT